MNKLMVAILGCAALALRATPMYGCYADPVNLVQNCGFETGDSTSWTVGGDTSGFFVGDFDPNTGTYSAVFYNDQSFATGPSLSQSFTTTPGASYMLTYELTETSSDPDGFQAVWDGFVIAGSTILDAGDFDYTAYQFTVQGTGLDTLQFQTYQDQLADWALDDVTLDQTQTGAPEPSSLMLISGGIVGLGLWRWRLKRAA